MLVARQGISQNVLRTRVIYDQEVEFGEHFSLTSLALVKLLSCYKVLEHLIVSLDTYYRIRAS